MQPLMPLAMPQTDPYSLIANQMLAQLHRDRRQHQHALDVLRALPASINRDARHHLLIGACLSDMGQHRGCAGICRALMLKHDSRSRIRRWAFAWGACANIKRGAPHTECA